MPDTTPTPPADANKHRRERVEKLLARPATERSASVGSGAAQLDYRVTAAFQPVASTGGEAPDAIPAGQPAAAVLTIAYQQQGADPRTRPVCFAFNGGPGSTSVWLHLGALGPKRVVVPDDGSAGAPPFAVEDNPQHWLRHFDLVFVDPPHTGWSTTASEATRKRMLSVDGDVAALTEVIRSWLTRHGRWGAPVYVAGESYGTTRGAAIANQLQELGVPLAGVILVSCAMDLQSIVFTPANDLPYTLFLPGFANVAQYHGLLKGPLAASPEAARSAAEAFVAEDYAAALLAGARLDGRRRSRVARRLAELTGLPLALVEEKNLRIADQTYFFEALRSRGQIVGRLDARATGPMAASRSRDWEFDPGMDAIVPAYTSAALAYYAELGLDLQERYEVFNPEVNRGWNWMRGAAEREDRMGFTSTSPDLARVLRRNPHLKVLAASGRYDLGTPYSASDWSLAQLDAPADVLARVQHRYYDAGHMMYTRQADLAQLQADLGAWLKG